MRAVILAAGQGKRMRPLTNNLPKCLLNIDGIPIIYHQIETLKSCQIKKICLVLGHYHEKVKSFLGENYDYVLNKDYQKTDSLKSLWLARKFFDDDLLILSNDVVFEKKLIVDLIRQKKGVCITVNTKWNRKEGYKIATQDNRVVNMGPTVKKKDVFGESGEIIKIKKPYLPILKTTLKDFINQGLNKCWLEDAFIKMAKSGVKLNYFDVKNYFWYEFDTPKEWEYANKLYEQYKNGKRK